MYPPPPTFPRIPLMSLLFESWICWYMLVVDIRSISTFLYVHWAMNSHMRQLLNFYQLRFLEFHVNVLEAILIHHSLCMKECPFEFDTSNTGTTTGFIFQMVTSLIESWGVRLTCLDWKIFKPRLIFNFLCLLAKIIHELGLGYKENWESTYQ